MIDIIITTYNRVNFLRKTMESFFKNTDMSLVGQIIITDDGSNDGTIEYLESLKTELQGIKIIHDGQRKGLIQRFNQAFLETKSEYVCEFQDDVILDNGWLSILLEKMEKYDKIAHFVTGFDAPEHNVCYSISENYKIKPSSRFTQLLAKREIWSKWFPMEPMHSFPTPVLKDGEKIGSGIDCQIYRDQKNKWKSGVKFLVVPGLVQHIAEKKGSTWRGEAEEGKKTRDPKKQEWLKIEEIEKYWNKRSEVYKEKSVGFQNEEMKDQEEHYRQRYDFILGKIPLDRKTLDYGCGSGRYSQFFDKEKYIGMDICENLLRIAEEKNPGYCYHKLNTPVPEEIGFKAEMFFTATVLQHNCDEVVEKIFQKLAIMAKGRILLCLYENTSKKKGGYHICFRSEEKYLEMIEKNLEIMTWQSDSHIIHGEEHSLIIVEAQGKKEREEEGKC